MQNQILKPSWPAPEQVYAFTFCDGKPSSLLPEHPRILNQVHENSIVNWDQTSYREGIQADASYTTKPHIVCAVRTADCLPIVLTDTAGSFVASVHAGWRGLHQEIIAATLSQIVKRTHILAWMGPAIGPQHFLVKSDVYDAFADKKGFTQINETHWSANLFEIAKNQLIQNGVLSEHIYCDEICTFSDPTRFPSYRRDQEKAGRMLTVIWKD